MALLDLFRPKWKHSNAEVRLQAIAPMTDRSRLLRMCADADQRISEAAGLRYIELEINESSNGDEALAKLITNTTSVVERAGIQSLAVRMLKDESVLEEVARTASSLWHRRKAALRLTSQESIGRFIGRPFQEQFDGLQISDSPYASEKLSWCMFLESLVDRIDEEDVLESLCLIPGLDLSCGGGPRQVTRQTNFDSEVYAEEKVWGSDEPNDPIRKAFRKITDENRLRNIALRTPSRSIRTIALERISDPELYAEAALNEEDHFYRRWYFNGIHRAEHDAKSLPEPRPVGEWVAAALTNATDHPLSAIKAICRIDRIVDLAKLHSSLDSESLRRLVSLQASHVSWKAESQIKGEFEPCESREKELLEVAEVSEDDEISKAAILSIWDPLPLLAHLQSMERYDSTGRLIRSPKSTKIVEAIRLQLHRISMQASIANPHNSSWFQYVRSTGIDLG